MELSESDASDFPMSDAAADVLADAGDLLDMCMTDGEPGCDHGALPHGSGVIAEPSVLQDDMYLEIGSVSSGAEDGGMNLEQLSDGQGLCTDNETAADDTPAQVGGWRPGKDCGQWLIGKLSLIEQSQVLITNLYLSLRQLPASVKRTVLDHLCPGHGATRNFADRLSAVLLGVSRSTARYVFERMQDNNWQPRPPQSVSRESADTTMPASVASPLSETHAMKVRVREILAICSAGRPDVDYVHAMRRLQLHGLDVGDKHLSRKFVEPVELLAATAAMAETTHLLGTVCPSLGIAPDIALIWDGVSIGARSFSRYETLYLIGCTHMVWQDSKAHGVSLEPSCRMKASFLVGPSAGQKHTGHEQVELLYKALAEHPAKLDRLVLRARLAAVGSDGAASRGGPDSQHGSTGASEQFWEALHPGVPPMVEWDLFHRIDAGTSKAISCSPAALEIFDVARVLGQLFGVGDGRVIFRAAAAAAGTKHLRVPDQGGTRKVVALARSVSRLLQSLPAYQAGLHARRGQAEERRGSQSKAHLVAIGRRVTALSFVVFAVAVNDVLKMRVAPLALRSQAIAGSAWQMDRLCRATMKHLKEDVESMKLWRIWVFLSALLQQFLTSRELKRLWFVLSTLWWKRFPVLATNGFNLLHLQEFNGCMLSVVRQGDQSVHHMLSPKCQCPSMQQCPGPGRPRLGRVRFGPRDIQVPEWVSHSVYDRAEWQKIGFIGPRFVQVRKEHRSRPNVAGLPGRYRQGVAPCRCVVSFVFAAAVDDVLAAISEAIAFITSLEYYLSAYAVGSVGVPVGVRMALDQADKCWDWEALLWTPPREVHYRAFFALYESLLPTLKHTQWPSDERFAWLVHSWPGLRGKNGAFEQYRALMQRVRKAAPNHVGWRSCEILLVEPVWSSAHLAVSIGVKFGAAALVHRHCILFTIQCFLTGPPSDIAGRPYEVASADLAALTFGRSARRARATKRHQEYRGHSFASHASRHMAGRLVRVVGTRGSPIEERVAASILSETAFAFPDSSGSHCWHVLRVYLRSRMARAPESGCERWGSFLHSLWDPVAGWEPHRMVSRLLIKEAGLGEDVVHEIAEALTGWMGKTTRTKGCLASSQQQPTSENLPVRMGLREQGIDRDQWKANAKPSQLLGSANRAVKDALRLGRGSAMAALPMFAEDARTTRQNRANSVVNAALRRFLESDDGRQWQADRKALFGAAAA